MCLPGPADQSDRPVEGVQEARRRLQLRHHRAAVRDDDQRDPLRPPANHRRRQRRPGPPRRPQPGEVTFENTVRALDDIGYQISLTDDRFGLIKETSTNAALRDAATDALKELEEWTVGIDYREDVYKALKAYADKKPKLKGEDAKLLAETMRDYRRAGLDLPKAQRDEVERMRKELTRLTTDFESNITKAQKAVKFTKAELEGVPESFLAQVKTGDDEYTVMANITWHYLSVMDNAKREETRKKLLARARQPGPRGEHPAARKDPAAARRHRPEARLQDLGRLPDRSQDGRQRRHGH